MTHGLCELPIADEMKAGVSSKWAAKASQELELLEMNFNKVRLLGHTAAGPVVLHFWFGYESIGAISA